MNDNNKIDKTNKVTIDFEMYVSDLPDNFLKHVKKHNLDIKKVIETQIAIMTDNYNAVSNNKILDYPTECPFCSCKTLVKPRKGHNGIIKSPVDKDKIVEVFSTYILQCSNCKLPITTWLSKHTIHLVK